MLNRFTKRLIVVPLFLIMMSSAGIISDAAATERMMIEKAVDGNTIGCVLPLTGQYAAAGNRALDAIILAAGVFDPLVKSPIKLIIEDSKSQPEGAKTAVNKLALKDGVICILGPLGNTEALEAAKEAQKLKIPIITLTRKERITDIGDYVFRSYMTNSMQIETLVKYVTEELGLTRFAVLYPDDNYGREMDMLFGKEVKRQEGEIRKELSYDKTQTDFGDEIKEIIGLKKVSSKAKEKDVKDDNKPDIDFDALFIPDSPGSIRMIVPQLAFYNVINSGVKLLGTSIWDSPDILKAEGNHLEGAVFTDGFCLNSFSPETNDFIDIFYADYSREPDVMEALVYDAASMIIKVIKEDETETRTQFRDSLLRLKNYRGVTGKISFSGMRDAQKNIFILTIKDGQILQIK
ncbi:MAG TPA: penicillin-binding protein activator [Syntrophales bacterium]|nr:penicillin-binding protein activator [Syntrophales bacterium]